MEMVEESCSPYGECACLSCRDVEFEVKVLIVHYLSLHVNKLHSAGKTSH